MACSRRSCVHRLGEGLLAPTLLMEGEDVQLDGEIYLAHLDVSGNHKHDGGEVQDASDASTHETVDDLLRCICRSRDHCNLRLRLFDKSFKAGEREHADHAVTVEGIITNPDLLSNPESRADDIGVGIDEANDLKSP